MLKPSEQRRILGEMKQLLTAFYDAAIESHKAHKAHKMSLAPNLLKAYTKLDPNPLEESAVDAFNQLAILTGYEHSALTKWFYNNAKFEDVAT